MFFLLTFTLVILRILTGLILEACQPLENQTDLTHVMISFYTDPMISIYTDPQHYINMIFKGPS